MENNDSFLQAEKNLVSKFTYMPEILGYKIEEKNSVRIINCNLKTSMFNIACNAKFNETDLDSKINYVIGQYKRKPFAWWVGPTDSPNNLQERILKAGFKKETDEYAMFCDLSDFQEFELNKNISVRQVEKRKELIDFIGVISFYDQYVSEFLDNELVISNKVRIKNPMFVSYIDEKPVGIGALHFNNDIAGIYDIITPEGLRGQGIGTNIMKFLMNYAYRQNIRGLCLSASSDSGFRIYEKLGFKVVGKFGCFEWKE